MYASSFCWTDVYRLNNILWYILQYFVVQCRTVCRKNIIYLHAGANTHVYKRRNIKVLTGSYFSAVLLSFPSRICWLLLCREMLKTDKFPEVSFIFEIPKKKSDVLKNVSWNKLNARTIFQFNNLENVGIS